MKRAPQSNPSKTTVMCMLPKAGLGNCLLVWAKSLAFSREHQLPLQTYGWNQFHPGPWLRGERVKRYYGTYFNRDVSRPEAALRLAKLVLARPERKLRNPTLAAFDAGSLRDKRWVVFDEVPDWRDYFADIRAHRALVREELQAMLRPDLLEQVANVPAPEIGLHVRLGDFRCLRPDEDFSKVGSVRTPQQYFQQVIADLRAIMGNRTTVTVFSDGRPHELSELLRIPGVRLSEPAADIIDMLTLARSRVIVPSAGSTFGYWAGFLSDAPILMHPDHIHGAIRGDGDRLFEGTVDGSPAQRLAEILRA